MDAYALFDALTDVRDGFLEETERRLHGEKRRPDLHRSGQDLPLDV